MRTKKVQLSNNLKLVIMTHKSEHKYYTKNFKDKRYKFKNKDEYQSFIRQFFKAIGDNVINNKDGVLIEDIGYFFNAMDPVRKIYETDFVTSFNLETEQRIYAQVFCPVQEHCEWIMDKNFSKYIKKAVFEKLKSKEIRYKSNYYYLKKQNLIY